MHEYALQTVLTTSQSMQLTSLAFCRCSSLNHHHVAVALSCKTGHVLASATNSATAVGSVHAERAVLYKLSKQLQRRRIDPKDVSRGVHILSLRITAGQSLRLAKPCQPCMTALRNAAPLVRWVAWSDDDGELIYRRNDVSME